MDRMLEILVTACALFGGNPWQPAIEVAPLTAEEMALPAEIVDESVIVVVN
jgi:hypothetical protein